MASGSGAALQARLDEVASAIDGVERRVDATGVRYVRAGIPFAIVTDAGVAVRLAPDIARAALRTPDVRPSEAGEGWVELVAARLDVFTADRAVSWFESAARHAG